MVKTIQSDVKIATILRPITVTADNNGTGIDLANANTNTILVAVGASGDTLSGSVYWNVKLQESDDNTTFTDVADADTVGGDAAVTIDAAAEDDVTLAFSYIGSKRYVRVVLDATGTHTNGTPFSVIALTRNQISPVTPT